MSLQSEGAALLLVWAANLIKLFACTKKFGSDPDLIPSQQTRMMIAPLNLDEVYKISARTQMLVKREQEARKMVEKEEEQARQT